MYITLYKIINNVNDEIYVGSTKGTLKQRWIVHKSKSKKNPEQNGLYVMMNEYGYDCFDIVCLEECKVENKAEQLKIEQQYMNELKPGLNKMNAFGQKCEHGNVRCQCKPCSGSRICLHGNYRAYCKNCSGSQICLHGIQRYYCKPCGGSGICEHGSQRAHCKPCGGRGFCQHGFQKHNCKTCSPMYCAFCKLTTSKMNWNKHLKSKKHITNTETILTDFVNVIKDNITILELLI